MLRVSQTRSRRLSPPDFGTRICIVGSLICLVTPFGCRSARDPTSPARSVSSPPIHFTDVAPARGVRFRHTNGSSGRRYLAETMGAGCAFLDYDGDGRLDLFFVNSSRLPGFKGRGPFYPALYHQRADGQFEDVTRRAGLAIDAYGMGCAVGDYDNDGHPDLYLTAVTLPASPVGTRGRHLFHNSGRGTFREVTRSAGVPGPAWGTSAAWVDYDRDGFLDLFVCSYCRWSPVLNQSCGDICGPAYYRGTASVLYHNNGDGTFTDVSRRAHVAAAGGKALGVVVWDENEDGWPDLAVTNDTEPNWLFRNNGASGPASRLGGERSPPPDEPRTLPQNAPSAPPAFTEAGVEAGIAYGPGGQARAGMGVDTADVDGSGREALLIGDNASEGLGLFRPGTAAGTPFTEGAEAAGLLRSSMPFSTFGALFVDLDRDGFADIVTANGHINRHQAQLGGSRGFAQRMLLFHNEPGETPGARRFREIGAAAGRGIAAPRVGRGLAAGDFDGDGAPDLLVSANNGPAALLRNDTAGGNHWLAVRLRGVKSNREGLGTRVVLRTAGRTQRAWVRSGSSYGSESEHVARFGLGSETRIGSIELHWPSGRVQTLRGVKGDQLLVVTEPRG